MTNQASEDELDQNITDILLEHLVLANDNGQPYIQYTDVAVDKILELIADQVAKARIVTGETSDGYHTFNELYEYRKLYNALLFNEWYQTKNYGIHKSKRHSDGNLCFGGGWFVVVAELPAGQVTNHYELKDWGLFKVEERHKAVEYDGHTPQEAAKRLLATLNGVKNR